MIIYKHVEKQILRPYTFIKGNINLDSSYFINEIEKGINDKNNNNYKTNIVGQMTDWKYFVKDKLFIQVVTEIFSKLEKETDFLNFAINEAWGLKQGYGEKTKKHNHLSSYISGIIYLSKCDQPLVFDEVNEKVEVEIGNFAIFDSWLTHGCSPSLDNTFKYGISFNTTRNHGIFTN